MTKRILPILIGLLVTSGIFASDASETTGREVAEQGHVCTLDGALELEDGEWYLRTEEQSYIVHKGPDWYPGEINFPEPEGKQATVQGFVLGDEISPCTITIGETQYVFRSLEGFPLWAGRGDRFTSSAEHE